MSIGTVQEDPSFMKDALDTLRAVELARLRIAKKSRGLDKWTLSKDERYIKSPQNYISMMMYVEVLEILARLAC